MLQRPNRCVEESTSLWKNRNRVCPLVPSLSFPLSLSDTTWSTFVCTVVAPLQLHVCSPVTVVESERDWQHTVTSLMTKFLVLLNQLHHFGVMMYKVHCGLVLDRHFGLLRQAQPNRTNNIQPGAQIHLLLWSQVEDSILRRNVDLWQMNWNHYCWFRQVSSSQLRWNYVPHVIFNLREVSSGTPCTTLYKPAWIHRILLWKSRPSITFITLKSHLPVST